jgi:hypothetical protein
MSLKDIIKKAKAGNLDAKHRLILLVVIIFAVWSSADRLLVKLACIARPVKPAVVSVIAVGVASVIARSCPSCATFSVV